MRKRVWLWLHHQTKCFASLCKILWLEFYCIYRRETNGGGIQKITKLTLIYKKNTKKIQKQKKRPFG